ncbi:MAG: hypothetical protein WA817_05735 [Candidatus Acidiferrum sp.]
MSSGEKAVEVKKPWRLSLDSWAVLIALFAALLVRAGVLKHIPW